MNASRAMKRVLWHSGLLALARNARTRARALVLRYHAITDGPVRLPYATPDICLPVEAFRLQMAFVRRAYRVVPLGDLVAALAGGGPLPSRAVAITFDDGYADNHQLAFPVLRRLGVPATVYVVTGPLDGGPPLWMAALRVLVEEAPGPTLVVPGLDAVDLGPRGGREAHVRALTRALVPLRAADRQQRLDAAAAAAGVDPAARLAGTMLTWAAVRELHAAGWTIAAHTVSHPNVVLAPRAEAEAEIVASRDRLAAEIGAPVVDFAYPNTGGRHRPFDAEIVALVRRLGFRSGATSVPGALRAGTDPLVLPRVGVSPRLAGVVELAAALERQRLAA
jgi:peptidoglycan/xylan/chitin deacetylase (PgdA/CDA1 family)